MIKKCKRIFISYIPKHINKYLNEDLLLDLKYSLIDDIKKESNLKLLDTKLKDLVSNKISPKNSSKDENWNKLIIDKIMKSEKNNEKLMNLLNMTFNEWIDIFTYKTENKFYKESNLLQSALEEIYKNNKNDKEYLSKLIFHLYNYKRWFEKKRGRNEMEKSAAEKKEEI
jgi:hypothetical protein